MTKRIIDNPANRLHAILEGCNAIDRNANCRKAWQIVLQTEDESILLARMAKVLELSDAVVEVMGQVFPRHLSSVNILRSQVQAGFTQQSLNGNWASFMNPIAQDSLVSLAFTASLLDERERLKPIQETSLKEHRDTLHGLQQEVIAADDIDDDVKLTIVRYLGRLISALDEYFITGVVPVLDATNTAVGNVAFDKPYSDTLANHELGIRVATALANVANSVTIGTGLLQLVEPVTHLLKLLGSS